MQNEVRKYRVAKTIKCKVCHKSLDSLHDNCQHIARFHADTDAHFPRLFWAGDSNITSWLRIFLPSGAARLASVERGSASDVG